MALERKLTAIIFSCTVILQLQRIVKIRNSNLNVANHILKFGLASVF